MSSLLRQFCQRAPHRDVLEQRLLTFLMRGRMSSNAHPGLLYTFAQSSKSDAGARVYIVTAQLASAGLITCCSHMLLTVHARSTPDALTALHDERSSIKVLAGPCNNMFRGDCIRAQVRQEACWLDVGEVLLRVRACLEHENA